MRAGKMYLPCRELADARARKIHLSYRELAHAREENGLPFRELTNARKKVVRREILTD